MPVVDKVAADYADRVAFVAVAWHSTFEKTATAATSLMPSGLVRWGLDADEHVFAAYGIPYQPATLLLGTDERVVVSWAGERTEAEMRAALDTLLAGTT